MKSYLKFLLLLTGLLMIVAGGVFVYYRFHRDENPVSVREGVISHVETMARLCSMEIYSEIPIKDTINNKVLIGIQKQRGKITFDLEKLTPDLSKDTIVLTLPRERVELYEATANNSWEIVDTKRIGFLSPLLSDKLTAEEDNSLKNHIRTKSIRRLYEDGTVARARKEAVTNLERLMSILYGKPVVVKDPTPSGQP